MEDLQTLTLHRYDGPLTLIRVLNPSTNSSGVVACPKLEELVIEHPGKCNIMDVVAMAAARALRGAKLKTVRFISGSIPVYPRVDVLKLRKHVLRVEC